MSFKPRCSLRSGEHVNFNDDGLQSGSEAASLEKKIADSLGESRSFDAADVAATVTNDRLVLTGEVLTQDDRVAVEDCVRTIAGNLPVENRLIARRGSH
ncbi:BON domain-containing protein [Pararhizobium haloflavum]|uniref:BON domain-containing protein n=1 Tax=Pararhizobium haloflavum TaxID=2037914 RepID=UPI000C1A1A00|nr:BON domain-containing protein [Pararhizobium haloflavum]